jgi:DNA-binding CsgD family transcriptional regulator
MVQRNLLRRARGRPPYPGIFTPAEQRVLQGLKRGHTYQQIADELGLSYDTVKYHVSNMLSKAQVERRDELVAFAGQPGLRWSALPTSLMWAGGAAAAAAFVTFAVLVLVNRGGNDDPAAPDATQTAQASGTPTIPASGVPIVDEFIKVALGGDLTKLEPLTDYQPVPCSSNQQGIGAPPPCPAGSADGTPVPAVFSSGCEGSYITESSMPGLLASWNLGFNGVFSASTIRPGSEESTDGPAAYSVVITFKQWADGVPSSSPGRV